MLFSTQALIVQFSSFPLGRIVVVCVSSIAGSIPNRKSTTKGQALLHFLGVVVLGMNEVTDLY
jgi:hypothetical protein